MWSCMTSAASSSLMRYDHFVLNCFMTNDPVWPFLRQQHLPSSYLGAQLHLLAHACTYSLTHAFARSLTHSLTHPLTHSPTHLLTHSPIHPFTYWEGILCSSSCAPTCSLHLPHQPPTCTVVAENLTPYGTYSWDTVQAVFWQEFHESRGDMQIRLSSWSRHTALGHVRELSFISPIKVSIQQPKTPLFALVAVISLQAIITPDGSHADHLFCIDTCWCCLLPKQMAYSLSLSLLSIPQANSALLSVLSGSNKLTERGRRSTRFSMPHNSNTPPQVAPAASAGGAWCTRHTHGCM